MTQQTTQTKTRPHPMQDVAYAKVRTADAETPTEVEELEISEPKEFPQPPVTINRQTWFIISVITFINIVVLCLSVYVIRFSQTGTQTQMEATPETPKTGHNHNVPKTCWMSNRVTLQQTPLHFGTSDDYHPLNPLTTKEIAVGLRTLELYRKENLHDMDAIMKKASGCGGASVMFTFVEIMYSSITLEEPTKQEVLQWSGDRDVIPRRAKLVYHVNRANITHSYEAIVHLGAFTTVVKNITEIAQPSFTRFEQESIPHILNMNDNWKEAMLKRGYGEKMEGMDMGTKDLYATTCVPRGFEHANTRSLTIDCYDGTDAHSYLKPIEGLSALVNFESLEVDQVQDTGVIPVRNPSVEPLPIGNRKMRTGVFVTQPKGPSFIIQTNMVYWDRWRFHLKFDERSGYQISLASFAEKRVLYKMYLAELLVQHVTKNGNLERESLYVNEFGLGQFIVDMYKTEHCPPNSHFIAIDMDGDSKIHYPGGLCVFERYNSETSRVTFDRYDKDVSLVVRVMFNIRNYQYTIDTEFTQHGEIKAHTSVTGVPFVKTSEEEVIATGTSGLQSDHFFTYYLDMDVEESENSFVVEKREKGRKEEKIATELTAKRVSSSEETWSFKSSNAAYVLEPSSTVVPLFTHGEEDYMKHNLWVTVFNETKRYPNGEYPIQVVEEGLTTWTKGDHSIDGQDIVAWYTMGLRHIPSREDYPFLTRRETHFTLKPKNFVELNPYYQTSIEDYSASTETFGAVPCNPV